MNTMTFIFGQLLTLETLAAQEVPLTQRLHRIRYKIRLSLQPRKEKLMDNSILVIVFLVVSLIANFAMPTNADDQSSS